MAWKEHPEYPQAPTYMIEVARGLSRADIAEQQVWFERAVRAQLDYQDAYDDFVMSLRPTWGGSYEQMEQFGKACLATGRFDTNVPWKYVNAVYSVWTESSHTQGLDRPGVYEFLAKACNGYLKAAQTEEDRNCYRTDLAGFAWYTHHYADARAALEATGAHAQPSVLPDLELGAGLADTRGRVTPSPAPPPTSFVRPKRLERKVRPRRRAPLSSCAGPGEESLRARLPQIPSRRVGRPRALCPRRVGGLLRRPGPLGLGTDAGAMDTRA